VCGHLSIVSLDHAWGFNLSYYAGTLPLGVSIYLINQGLGCLTETSQLSYLRLKTTRGGQRSKCPNMCHFCTRKPAIHCPFIRLVPFLL